MGVENFKKRENWCEVQVHTVVQYCRLSRSWWGRCAVQEGMDMRAVQCVVGWSDILFFAFFDWLYFFSFNSKHAWQSFPFQKITVTLQIDIFWKFANIFLLLHRTITKKKIWETFFSYFMLGLQKGQHCFWPGQRKNKFWVSLHF